AGRRQSRARRGSRLPAAHARLADVSHAIRDAARFSGRAAMSEPIRQRVLWLVWSVVLLASLGAVVRLDRTSSHVTPVASGFGRTNDAGFSRTSAIDRYG